MAEDINIHDVVVPGPDLALDPGQDLPFLLLANGAVECRLCPAANGQFHQFPTRPLYARHCRQQHIDVANANPMLSQCPGCPRWFLGAAGVTQHIRHPSNHACLVAAGQAGAAAPEGHGGDAAGGLHIHGDVGDIPQGEPDDDETLLEVFRDALYTVHTAWQTPFCPNNLGVSRRHEHRRWALPPCLYGFFPFSRCPGVHSSR